MASSELQRGVIYILLNPSYPGMLKIGRTKNSALRRARELSTSTGVPQPFEVVYDTVVSDAVAAEREIHEALFDMRPNPKREFFSIKIRDAISLVQQTAERYPVDPEIESEEIDILPDIEERMRRWLRRDLVGLKFVQYSDLCLLKIAFQPSVLKPDAFETIFDLRVLGENEGNTDDCDICGQSYYSEQDPCEHRDLTFDPFRRSIRYNSRLFVEELDAYSMCMVGMDIINMEAADYICDRRLASPKNANWHVVESRYEIWGDPYRPPVVTERMKGASTPLRENFIE
ncbi:GIY-YIG nuclease family protein [Saccharopolyspora sp. NPDC047091]|uniref:GIY-YIG nuclease family protein n=1 Tax=Saccharopolyspora sp. NPDC047091 TaxID=3155924 RepID=UPI0034111ED5